jgi:similar to spore coat protein
MGLLDMLLGTNTTLGNQDIASDMLKDSKFAVISLAKAVTEVTNPQLKTLLVSQLFSTIEQHHQLSDLAASREWYLPFLPTQQQVSTDLQMAKNLSSS